MMKLSTLFLANGKLTCTSRMQVIEAVLDFAQSQKIISRRATEIGEIEESNFFLQGAKARLPVSNPYRDVNEHKNLLLWFDFGLWDKSKMKTSRDRVC